MDQPQGETLATFNRRLVRAGVGIILGRFPHDCQDDDIEDVIGGQRCRVCDAFVERPEKD